METSVITIGQAMHDQKISSIEIASLIGKPHNDLMKAIRKMEPAWEQEHLGKFSQMQIQESLPNGGYRLRPCYMLSKTESLFIATKFNDVARARLILRWEQLETERKQAVKSEPRRLLVTEREILLKGDEIRRQEIVKENANTDGCLTTREVASLLDMTVKELNKILVEKGIIYYNGGRYKICEEYAEMCLSQDRAFHYYGLNGEKKQRLYLVWTPEGAEFIKDFVNK
jgi:phage regulator Rha-like protein